MASSGVTITNNSETYVDDLQTMNVFGNNWATEVENAREGENNLLLNMQNRIPYTGASQTINLNGQKIENAVPATASTGYVTLSQVNALIAAGGSPGDIAVTDLDVGTASSLQLIRANAAGDGLEGYTLDLNTSLEDRFLL